MNGAFWHVLNKYIRYGLRLIVQLFILANCYRSECKTYVTEYFSLKCVFFCIFFLFLVICNMFATLTIILIYN